MNLLPEGTLAMQFRCPVTHSSRAVDVLKGCAASGEIRLLVARDDKSRSDFKRLSNSLLQQQLFWKPPTLAQGESSVHVHVVTVNSQAVQYAQ